MSDNAVNFLNYLFEKAEKTRIDICSVLKYSNEIRMMNECSPMQTYNTEIDTCIVTQHTLLSPCFLHSLSLYICIYRYYLGGCASPPMSASEKLME